MLLSSAGCWFSRALHSMAVAVHDGAREFVDSVGSSLLSPPVASPVSFYLYSDAAAEASSGGLGGWVHGEWWHFPLDHEELDLLHITALELTAVGVNIIIYGPTLAGCRAVVCADALATVQVLNRGSARAPAMQAVFGLIAALPEYKALAPLLEAAHVFGEVNVMADAASRAKFSVLQSIAKGIGVASRHVELPERAVSFIRSVKAAAAKVQEGRDQVARAHEVELIRQAQRQLLAQAAPSATAALGASRRPSSPSRGWS